MADAMTSVDELLAESVRLYPVLYNKADKFFKDVMYSARVYICPYAYVAVSLVFSLVYACAYALVRTSLKSTGKNEDP